MELFKHSNFKNIYYNQLLYLKLIKNLIIKLLYALIYLYKKYIIYYDFKPFNIIVISYIFITIKIMDFNLIIARFNNFIINYKTFRSLAFKS